MNHLFTDDIYINLCKDSCMNHLFVQDVSIVNYL